MNAVHVAGAVGVPPGCTGQFSAAGEGVFFHPAGKWRSASIDLTWDQVRSIEAVGSNEMQSRTSAAAVVAFGPLGLLAKSNVKRAYFVVTPVDGPVMTFEVKDITPIEAMARMRANPLAAPKVRTSPPATSSVDDLARLVEMHNSGALDDEEFKAAKRRMLGL